MNFPGVCLLLLVGAGGYGTYWGYQQYNELTLTRDQLALTKAELSDSAETVKLLRAAYVSDATVLDENASTTQLPDNLKTLTGRVFSTCKLSGVEPDGIRLMHHSGAGKITFTELDPSFASVFGYDPLAGQNSGPSRPTTQR